MKLPDLVTGDYKPLYIQLRDIIAGYIRAKGLKPGDPLPSENELIRRYGISRTTARMADQQLEADGLVRKIRGKGTFVAAARLREQVRGFQNLEESLAEQGIVVSNVLLQSMEGHPPPWARELNLPAGSRARIIERLKTAAEKTLALEKRVLPLDVAARVSDEAVKSQPIFDALTAYPETDIYRVTYAIVGSSISEQDARKMKVPKRTPVLMRTGVYYNREERPVMAGRIVFLAQRIQLRYEFRREDKNWGIVDLV